MGGGRCRQQTAGEEHSRQMKRPHKILQLKPRNSWYEHVAGAGGAEQEERRSEMGPHLIM